MTARSGATVLGERVLRDAARVTIEATRRGGSRPAADYVAEVPGTLVALAEARN